MHPVPFATRWWRGLWAAALLLGLLSPQPTPAAVPDWLASTICHAPGDDAPGHPSNGAAPLLHCALCLVGQALAMPPAVPAPVLPRESHADLPETTLARWPGPGPEHAYASRAPPATI